MESRNDTRPKLCSFHKGSLGRRYFVHCERPLLGSWVKIRKDKAEPTDDQLTLCEVHVIGSKQGTLFFTKYTFMFDIEN